MLKYMLTTECPRKCKYCITRNVRAKEVTDLDVISNTLWELRKSHEQIMITGGEPTCAIGWEDRVRFCTIVFKEVYLTTQNKELLTNKIYTGVDAITFSIHDDEIPEVNTLTKVYGAVLDSRYSEGLAYELADKGYAGLTINEDQRGWRKFKIPLPQLGNFSIRINERGKCMDETILLPDLKVITDYRRYL